MKKLNKLVVTRNGAMEYLGDNWNEKSYKIDDDTYLIPYSGNRDDYRMGMVYGFVKECLWNAHKLWGKEELAEINESLNSTITFDVTKKEYTVQYPSTKKVRIEHGRSFDSVFKEHCNNTFRDHALYIIDQTLIGAHDLKYNNVIVF